MTRASARAGLLGLVGIMAFYGVVVGLASGSIDHLVDQVGADWWLLVPIMAGFAVQVALLTELRARHHGATLAAGTTSAGAGASAAGMVACCAHHLAELLPFLGIAGVATTLTAWRTELMLVGFGVNVVAIAIAWRRLRSTPRTHRHEEVHACAHA